MEIFKANHLSCQISRKLTNLIAEEITASYGSDFEFLYFEEDFELIKKLVLARMITTKQKEQVWAKRN